MLVPLDVVLVWDLVDQELEAAKAEHGWLA
jgi:hypothetical protein